MLRADPLTSKVKARTPRAACQRPGGCLVCHGSRRDLVALEATHWQRGDPFLDLGLDPGSLAAKLARARKFSCAHPRPQRWIGDANAVQNLRLGDQSNCVGAPGLRDQCLLGGIHLLRTPRASRGVSAKIKAPKNLPARWTPDFVLIRQA